MEAVENTIRHGAVEAALALAMPVPGVEGVEPSSSVLQGKLKQSKDVVLTADDKAWLNSKPDKKSRINAAVRGARGVVLELQVDVTQPALAGMRQAMTQLQGLKDGPGDVPPYTSRHTRAETLIKCLAERCVELGVDRLKSRLYPMVAKGFVTLAADALDPAIPAHQADLAQHGARVQQAFPQPNGRTLVSILDQTDIPFLSEWEEEGWDAVEDDDDEKGQEQGGASAGAWAGRSNAPPAKRVRLMDDVEDGGSTGGGTRPKLPGGLRVEYLCLLGRARTLSAMLRCPKPHRSSFALDALIRGLYQDAVDAGKVATVATPPPDISVPPGHDSFAFLRWSHIHHLKNLILGSSRGATVLNYVMGGTASRPVPIMADALRVCPAYEYVWYLCTMMEVLWAAVHDQVQASLGLGRDELPRDEGHLPLSIEDKWYENSLTGRDKILSFVDAAGDDGDDDVSGVVAQLQDAADGPEPLATRPANRFMTVLLAKVEDEVRADRPKHAGAGGAGAGSSQAAGSGSGRGQAVNKPLLPPWTWRLACLGRLLNPARCPELHTWLLQLTHPLSICNIDHLRRLVRGELDLDRLTSMATALDELQVREGHQYNRAEGTGQQGEGDDEDGVQYGDTATVDTESSDVEEEGEIEVPEDGDGLDGGANEALHAMRYGRRIHGKAGPVMPKSVQPPAHGATHVEDWRWDADRDFESGMPHGDLAELARQGIFDPDPGRQPSTDALGMEVCTAIAPRIGTPSHRRLVPGLMPNGRWREDSVESHREAVAWADAWQEEYGREASGHGDRGYEYWKASVGQDPKDNATGSGAGGAAGAGATAGAGAAASSSAPARGATGGGLNRVAGKLTPELLQAFFAGRGPSGPQAPGQSQSHGQAPGQGQDRLSIDSGKAEASDDSGMEEDGEGGGQGWTVDRDGNRGSGSSSGPAAENGWTTWFGPGKDGEGQQSTGGEGKATSLTPAPTLSDPTILPAFASYRALPPSTDDLLPLVRQASERAQVVMFSLPYERPPGYEAGQDKGADNGDAPSEFIASDDEEQYVSKRPGCYLAQMREYNCANGTRRDETAPWLQLNLTGQSATQLQSPKDDQGSSGKGKGGRKGTTSTAKQGGKGKAAGASTAASAGPPRPHPRPLTWSLLRALFVEHAHTVRGREAVLASLGHDVATMKLQEGGAITLATMGSSIVPALLKSWGLNSVSLQPLGHMIAKSDNQWSGQLYFTRVTGLLNSYALAIKMAGGAACPKLGSALSSIEERWGLAQSVQGSGQSVGSFLTTTDLQADAGVLGWMLTTDPQWPLVSAMLLLLVDACTVYPALADRASQLVPVALYTHKFLTDIRAYRVAHSTPAHASPMPSESTALPVVPEDTVFAVTDLLSWCGEVVVLSQLQPSMATKASNKPTASGQGQATKPKGVPIRRPSLITSVGSGGVEDDNERECAPSNTGSRAGAGAGSSGRAQATIHVPTASDISSARAALESFHESVDCYMHSAMVGLGSTDGEGGGMRPMEHADARAFPHLFGPRLGEGGVEPHDGPTVAQVVDEALAEQLSCIVDSYSTCVGRGHEQYDSDSEMLPVEERRLFTRHKATSKAGAGGGASSGNTTTDTATTVEVGENIPPETRQALMELDEETRQAALQAMGLDSMPSAAAGGEARTAQQADSGKPPPRDPPDMRRQPCRLLSWAVWRAAMNHRAVDVTSGQAHLLPLWRPKDETLWHVLPATPLLSPAIRPLVNCVQGRMWLTTLLRTRLLASRLAHSDAPEWLTGTEATHVIAGALGRIGLTQALRLCPPVFVTGGTANLPLTDADLRAMVCEVLAVCLHPAVTKHATSALAALKAAAGAGATSLSPQQSPTIATLCYVFERSVHDLMDAEVGTDTLLAVSLAVDLKDDALIQVRTRMGGQVESKTRDIISTVHDLEASVGLRGSLTFLTWISTLVLLAARPPPGTLPGSDSDPCGGLLADPNLAINNVISASHVAPDYSRLSPEFAMSPLSHDYAREARRLVDVLAENSALEAGNKQLDMHLRAMVALPTILASFPVLKERLSRPLVQCLVPDLAVMYKCMEIRPADLARAAQYQGFPRRILLEDMDTGRKDSPWAVEGVAVPAGLYVSPVPLGPTYLHGANVDHSSVRGASQQSMNDVLIQCTAWTEAFVTDIRLPSLFIAQRVLPGDRLSKARPWRYPSASALAAAMVFPQPPGRDGNGNFASERSPEHRLRSELGIAINKAAAKERMVVDKLLQQAKATAGAGAGAGAGGGASAGTGQAARKARVEIVDDIDDDNLYDGDEPELQDQYEEDDDDIEEDEVPDLEDDAGGQQQGQQQGQQGYTPNINALFPGPCRHACTSVYVAVHYCAQCGLESMSSVPAEVRGELIVFLRNVVAAVHRDLQAASQGNSDDSIQRLYALIFYGGLLGFTDVCPGLDPEGMVNSLGPCGVLEEYQGWCNHTVGFKALAGFKLLANTKPATERAALFRHSLAAVIPLWHEVSGLPYDASMGS